MNEAQPAPNHRTTAAAVEAFGQVRAFDRRKISLRAGVVAAVPVAGMMVLGLLVANPTDAITLGVGAMLVGVAWRAGDGPEIPPIGTMAVDAFALAFATVAGTLTGQWGWLHLVVLALICLIAGVATTLGRRGALVGSQAVIAFVVFGRFPETVGPAFGLAGLVVAGGTAEVLFAGAVAFPRAWRRQRRALAAAYMSLADLSAGMAGPSAPAAAAFDAALAVLGAPALFADPELHSLTALATTGRRIRLELIVLGTAIAGNPDGVRLSQPALKRLQSTLMMIVAAIENSPKAVARLAGEAESLAAWGAEREPIPDQRIDERIAAVRGQITAAARTASELRTPVRTALGLRAGRPTLGHGLPVGGLREDLARMRSNLTLESAAGRHAVRLTVVVAGTELLTQVVSLPRGYWAVVAAATVLRPDFGGTFTRGAERVLGTLGGVVIASLIAVLIDPSGWGLVAVIAILACATYAVFPASFAFGTAMLTGVIVFLLHVAVADTTQTAFDRGIDTIIGGAIGLAAYALWPTWSGAGLGRLLANLIDSQRDYLQAVFDTVRGGQSPDSDRVRPLARRARIAWTDAQSAVTLARNEPRTGDLDSRQAAETLAALRRVVYGVHALRLEADSIPDKRPMHDLTALALALGESLSLEAATLRSHREENRSLPPLRSHREQNRSLPPLRRLYRDIEWPDDDQCRRALRPVLDELVDAVNTAAVSLGLEVP